MRKCKRNILIILGYLILMVAMFVPFQRENIQITIGPSGSITTIQKNGFVFTPIFIMNKSKYEYVNLSSTENLTEYLTNNPDGIFKPMIQSYSINKEILITEFAFILFFTGFLYILFCVVLRKREGGEC